MRTLPYLISICIGLVSFSGPTLAHGSSSYPHDVHNNGYHRYEEIQQRHQRLIEEHQREMDRLRESIRNNRYERHEYPPFFPSCGMIQDTHIWNTSDPSSLFDAEEPSVIIADEEETCYFYQYTCSKHSIQVETNVHQNTSRTRITHSMKCEDSQY